MGKQNFTLSEGISAMCFSGHKFHAPKGTGLAFIRHSIPYTSPLLGGFQENGKRPGTENLPSILSLAKAVQIIDKESALYVDKIRSLRDIFEEELQHQLKGVLINGKDRPRVSNTSNISFEGVEGEALLMNLDLEGIAASHGSACSSGSLEPSRVLVNMGFSMERVLSSIRFSLSKMTSQEEIKKSIAIIVKQVEILRKMVTI